MKTDYVLKLEQQVALLKKQVEYLSGLLGRGPLEPSIDPGEYPDDGPCEYPIEYIEDDPAGYLDEELGCREEYWEY
jgi:hypothetical protein